MRILSSLRRMAANTRNEYVRATRAQHAWTLWWKYYHWFNGREWLENRPGTVGVDHPHREIVVQAIRESLPVDTVLEIGCHLGYNLELLHAAIPGLHLFGVDINRRFVALVCQRFKMSDVKVELQTARADRLDSFADHTFDVVLCDAVLMYVSPRLIRRTLMELLRVCRKRIVLIEFVATTDGAASPWLFYRGKWAFDYPRLFRECAPACRVTAERLPEGSWGDAGWMERGQIVNVRL